MCNGLQCADQAEIDEMEDLLRQLDGQEDGEGDLLEDFVLSATEAKVHMLLPNRQSGRSFVSANTYVNQSTQWAAGGHRMKYLYPGLLLCT